MCDVLYRKGTTQNDPDEEQEDDSADSTEDDGNFIIEEENVGPEDIEENYGEICKKVRKIARFFRKSPLRNDRLQKIIRDDLQTELHLIIDVKTRWHTMFRSLERFYKVRKVIQFILKSHLEKYF